MQSVVPRVRLPGPLRGIDPPARLRRLADRSDGSWDGAGCAGNKGRGPRGGAAVRLRLNADGEGAHMFNGWAPDGATR